MPDALATILERAECAPPLFFADEVYQWPPESFLPWLDCGLLRPTTPARALPCNTCGRWHVAEILTVDDAHGKRAYVQCPTYGPSPINTDRLRRWEVDLGKLAETISAELHCRGHVAETSPQRFWHLGAACLAGNYHNVFLGRMLTHRDGAELLRRQHISKYGILFVPSMVPKLGSTDGHPTMFVFSVRDTVVPESDWLHLDRTFIESQVAYREEAAERVRSKRAERAALIAKLTKAMMEHIRAACDHAHATQRRSGMPGLLPRPTERQLARLLGATQASVHRCLADHSARELQYLWNLAVDLDRIMLGGGLLGAY